MANRYLIVDGHSIIFAWPDLRAIHSRRTSSARDELIRLLRGYQDASGVRVVVVFDGRGLTVTEESEPAGIQIFYSRAEQTADTIVERLCARYGEEHDLTVATDDHLEQTTALSFGANVVPSTVLRAMLEEAEDDLQRRLRQHRRKL